jgi:hypothetical protein
MPTVINDYYQGQMAYKLWFMSYQPNLKTREIGYGNNITDGAIFNPMPLDDKNLPVSVTKCGKIPADAGGMSNPFVIRDDNKYKMWYVGYENEDTNSPTRICYKESISH